MLQRLMCALFAVVLCTGTLLAEEVKAKVKEVVPHHLIVTVDGKEHKVAILKDTKIVDPKDQELKNGLKNPHLKEGVDVTLTFEEKDGKKVCTKVKLSGK
jgi:hypothetical protein